MTDDLLATWAAAIAPLDERLRPIATRKVDLADPDWAKKFPNRPTDAASLRKHLVLVAIHDQDDDPRDTIVWMDGILREARDAGVDVRPEVQEVAKITSDVDRWRYGSTRKLMLAAGER